MRSRRQACASDRPSLGLDALVLGFLWASTGILLHLAAALIITLATLVSAGIGASVGYRFGFAKQNLIHGIMASVLLLGAIGLGVLTLRSQSRPRFSQVHLKSGRRKGLRVWEGLGGGLLL